MPSGQMPVPSNTQEELQQPSSNTGKSGGESYTTDFPDSTKGTAQVSPPDPAGTPLFSFDTTMDTEFPDLAQREFLVPTLHVGAEGTEQKKEQDLYKRIEQRLESYRTEYEARRKGMLPSTSTRGLLKKPFPTQDSARRNGLEKKPSTSGPNY
jgi:hypothetical protein